MRDKPSVFFKSRAELRKWLAENSSQKTGIWAVFFKQSSGRSNLSWEAIVEECLCFGWIDSLPGKVDDEKTKIYLSPRKSNSGWSARNKRIIKELIQSNQMKPSGLAAIELAKSNGSWERFDLAESLVIPPALEKEFSRKKKFREAWKTLTQSKQRQFLQQIYEAKTSATQLKRIAKLEELLLSTAK